MTHPNISKDETNTEQDIKWMRKALRLAGRALAHDEVPVGALIIGPDGSSILASAFNKRESLPSTLGHAELIAIHKASRTLNSWRLLNCTLYSTLEPCIMCAGAIVQSRLKRVVFGATDKKGGGVVSLYNLLTDKRLNHQVELTGGVLESECSIIITNYFKGKRSQK